MSRRNVHILNGDALRPKLPNNILGKRIILREAFIDGPISTAIDDAFWKKRSSYIKVKHNIDSDEYAEKSELELLKIKQVLRDAHVNFWFEHDAFCQVNLWFACKLLIDRKFTGKAYLVLPYKEKPMWSGFGHMDENQLTNSFKNRLLISPRELRYLSNCWDYFATNHYDQLEVKYKHLEHLLPLGSVVFKALKGYKKSSLLESDVAKYLNNTNRPSFTEYYKSFSMNNGQLGLGDSQVKGVFEKVYLQKNISIERAQEQDADSFSAIALKAKAFWAYPKEWLKLWAAELTISFEDIKKDHYFKLLLDEQIIGFCGFSQDFEIEHFWIEPNNIGKGLGSILYKHVEDKMLGAKEIAVFSDPNAQLFYEKMGFSYSHEHPSIPTGRTIPVLKKQL